MGCFFVDKHLWPRVFNEIWKVFVWLAPSQDMLWQAEYGLVSRFLLIVGTAEVCAAVLPSLKPIRTGTDRGTSPDHVHRRFIGVLLRLHHSVETYPAY